MTNSTDEPGDRDDLGTSGGGIPDSVLPDDVRPDEDNPLAEGPTDDDDGGGTGPASTAEGLEG